MPGHWGSRRSDPIWKRSSPTPGASTAPSGTEPDALTAPSLPQAWRWVTVWLARIALLALVWHTAVLSFGPVRRWLHWDKAEHFAIGYVASTLMAIAFPRVPVWASGALVALIAGGAELAQARIPGRAASMEDFAASILGVAAALAAFGVVRFRQAFAGRADDKT